MTRAEEAAELLREIVERGKTSGRPGSDNDLSDVLQAALDPYELARLCAVARSHISRGNGARAREAAIAAGHLRTAEGECAAPADLGNGRRPNDGSTC